MKFKPAEKFIVPNDKQTKSLFSFSQNIYQNGKPKNVSEGVDEKGNKIKSPLKLILATSPNPTEEMTRPLDLFDRAILSACISEFVAGNESTTVGVIYRDVCGKRQACKAPTPNQARLILASIEKLSHTLIYCDLTKVCQEFAYNNGVPLIINNEPILPCQLEDGIFCHKPTRLIRFTAESPLLRIARAKNNQIISFDKSLLDGVKQHNSRTSIATRFYTINRVLECVNHGMTAKIIFTDIYEKCRIADADNFTKKKCRDVVLDTIQKLADAAIIKSFHLNRYGNEFVSVQFHFKYRPRQKK